ncbi:tetraspanin-8 [Amblyraja radiata]|uniref:tetraspanin-8 n=1 Tax=Amblyraja radiata TaxID=386614 RepID=UPI001403B9A6|nr:tetraspanin-8 [Amblyraja radiata]
MAGVSKCIKYSMFFFNFLFWLSGTVILAVSIWLRASNGSVKQIGAVSVAEFYPAINLLIAVGAIIMVFGFLGCCGAIKESRCMLLLFFIGLLLILAIQVTAGILGIVYKSQIEETLKEEYKKMIPISDQLDSVKQQIEEIQKENKCCGLLNGYKDWASVPASCLCPDKDSVGCMKTSNGLYWAKSCGTMLIDILKDHLVIVVGIALGLAVVEVFGLILSMTLYCQIKNK